MIPSSHDLHTTVLLYAPVTAVRCTADEHLAESRRTLPRCRPRESRADQAESPSLRTEAAVPLPAPGRSTNVRHTLGPLLAWEAAHPSDLVRTLEVHLRHGCSPTRTAALLHIGRQSLYQRLERIESLLGLEIDDPDLLGELLTAACAHRVVRGTGPAAVGGLRTVA